MIGANDTVNPAAMEDRGQPHRPGMASLEVWKAHNVIGFSVDEHWLRLCPEPAVLQDITEMLLRCQGQRRGHPEGAVTLTASAEAVTLY
ncbi:hypothetical protein ACNKHQ_09420 [Shigella flexneri]